MLTQDDILYMIVTDRFKDGLTSNNSDNNPGDPTKRHGGDFAGIVEKVPYLRDLGVTVLWITPVYVNPVDDYHGYHPVDFEQIDPHLCDIPQDAGGRRACLKKFIDDAHEHGLKVMLDIIVGHTAVNHPWLSERPDWFDPEGSSSEDKWWLWGLPHLNHDNLDVNLYFAKNVLDWIEDAGPDAIRIDAARHVEKRFWSIFKLFVEGAYPSVTVVGEVWDANPLVIAPYQQIYGFDSMFDYPLYHGILDVFVQGASFRRLARPELSDSEQPGVLNLDSEYRNANQLVTFIGNHDNPRFLTLAGADRDWSSAVARLKLALVFLFSTRGIPQLYYGDELGMTGGPDPHNRADMPWNLVDRPNDSYELAERGQEIRSFVRELIRARRSSKAICHGMLTTLFVTDTVYAFARCYFDDVRVIVMSTSTDPTRVVIPIAANSHLPRLAKTQLFEGCRLTDTLRPDRDEACRVEAGSIVLTVSGLEAIVLAPMSA